MTFEDVLADLRERITMLRVEGHPVQAASVERAVEQLVESLPEYLSWLSETEATGYTGRTSEYLRARFARWESRGLAMWRGRTRWYRRCVLEHRGNVAAAREAGRRAARDVAA
jgi:hypothetical protein